MNMPFLHFSVSELTDEQARKALLREINKHCCYGKGAVSCMEITKITPSNAMHVRITLLTVFTVIDFEPNSDTLQTFGATFITNFRRTTSSTINIIANVYEPTLHSVIL